MDRRSFLRNAVAAFFAPAAALAAQEAVAPTEAVVTNAFTYSQGQDCDVYAASDGVLWAGEDLPLFLVHGITFVVGGPPTSASLHVSRLIGPSKPMQVFYSRFGDVMQAAKNEAVVGLAKADGTSLWLSFPHAVLYCVGASLRSDDMIVTDAVDLAYSAHRDPDSYVRATAPLTRPREWTDAEVEALGQLVRT